MILLLGLAPSLSQAKAPQETFAKAVKQDQDIARIHVLYSACIGLEQCDGNAHQDRSDIRYLKEL